ncbi:PrsW family intramembrane metalloprotease [Quadrisphaera setariae]|uniref:PrsW family intramembrane metalloprotease n=1 Tax=Quadrisphaera setariae TaxID=2593304 RepID=UPI002103071A|nr:PrsW family intramembrane metalloprotease [Quadrisphaera setariae]
MRRWSWVLVLVVGLVLFEAVRRALVATGDPNFVPSLLLLGAAVAPATFIAFIAGRRLAYDVPALVVVLVAFVGGVVGVVTAGILEYDELRRLGGAAVLGVGLIEEGSKLVAPAAVLLLTRYRARVDGVLLGVASGAGFAALETMGYGFVALVESRGDVAAVDQVLLLRGLLSPAAHMAWTGLTAAALWSAASARFRPAALLRLLGAFVLAVLLHAAWDGIGGVVAYAVLSVISLTLLTVVVRRLGSHGHRRGRRGSTVPV